MGFNCKETPTLISLDSIINEARKNGSFGREDPANTVWYIENDSQLAVMVHPAYGMMFYNYDMEVMGYCELDCIGEIYSMLNDHGIEDDDPVWQQIGIDQVDYQNVS